MKKHLLISAFALGVLVSTSIRLTSAAPLYEVFTFKTTEALYPDNSLSLNEYPQGFWNGNVLAPYVANIYVGYRFLISTTTLD